MTLILSQREVHELLPVSECIDVMADALASLARGEAHQPLRSGMVPPDAPTFMGLMPTYRGGEQPLHALKALVLAPDNPKRGLDAHQGTVTLFDGVTGEVRAIMNASAVTEIRTAAVSGAGSTRFITHSIERFCPRVTSCLQTDISSALPICKSLMRLAAMGGRYITRSSVRV